MNKQQVIDYARNLDGEEAYLEDEIYELLDNGDVKGITEVSDELCGTRRSYAISQVIYKIDLEQESFLLGFHVYCNEQDLYFMYMGEVEKYEQVVTKYRKVQ